MEEIREEILIELKNINKNLELINKKLGGENKDSIYSRYNKSGASLDSMQDILKEILRNTY